VFFRLFRRYAGTTHVGAETKYKCNKAAIEWYTQRRLMNITQLQDRPYLAKIKSAPIIVYYGSSVNVDIVYIQGY